MHQNITTNVSFININISLGETNNALGVKNYTCFQTYICFGGDMLPNIYHYIDNCKDVLEINITNCIVTNKKKKKEYARIM
jgi:hypothetical protein